MDKKDIKQKMSEGWLRCIVIFELAGKPKEHVEQTIKQYIENIKKDGRINILEEEYHDIVEHDDGMFSTFVEAEMIVQNLEVLTWLSINFMPASIEIMEPAQITFSASSVTGWLNDLLSKLHEISTNYRNALSGQKNMTVALNALIKNAILTALEIRDMNEDDLQKQLGIHRDQLKLFLDHFIKKDRIIKKEDKYSLK